MDGQYFDMEVHLAHQNPLIIDENTTVETLMVAVFLKSDPTLKARCEAVKYNHIHCKRANFVEALLLGGKSQADLITEVSKIVAPGSYVHTNVSVSVDPYLGFMPPIGTRFYTYTGSMTAPPCTEGVSWIIHPVPVLVYKTTVGLLKNITGAYVDNGLTQGVSHSQNARPTQPMGDRKLHIVGEGGHTTLTEAAFIGATSLVVVDTLGFAAGDIIIIEPKTSRQESNTVTGFGSMLLATPLHYNHPAGAAIYSQTTTSPGVTVTPAAGVATTTPSATVTPIIPLRRYTEKKAAKGSQFSSNAVFLGAGCLIGFVVVMVVQGVRAKVQSARIVAETSDCEEGEARLLSSLE
jgi:hypothetical protein